MAEPFLRLQLHKSYGDFRLELEVELAPEVTAIFGPSGSGKSSTLNCIAGVTSPDLGQIILQGSVLFSSDPRVNLPPERRRIGYVFQDSLLFPHLSVRDNLLYGYRRTPPVGRRVDLGSLIDLLELGPLLDRRPNTLSGGEGQRVALGRAVAASPELLLLDEPLGSLDTLFRGRILRYLKTLHQELSIPMLYVSHNLSEVLALAHRAVVLSKGNLIAHGEPFRLLGQPGVAPLVDMGDLENLLDVEVVERRPETGLTQGLLAGHTLWLPQVDRPLGSVVSVALRAADILVATEEPQGLSARNVLPATIRELHHLPHGVLVVADVGVPLLAEISVEAQESLALVVGQHLFLIAKSSSITVLD